VASIARFNKAIIPPISVPKWREIVKPRERESQSALSQRPIASLRSQGVTPLGAGIGRMRRSC
jgi:hypothetical protein